MTVADVRHDRHIHRIPAGDAVLLALPEAQDVLARINAAVDIDYPHRIEHVRRIATIAILAKKNPTNSFARPTL